MRLGQGGISCSPKTWVRPAGQVAGTRPKRVLQAPKAKIVIYTALFGDADRLWSVPAVLASGVKYVAFVEKPHREVGLWTYDFGIERPRVLEGTEEVSPITRTWEQRIVKPSYENRKSARYFKVMAHRVLREADISIWVDANVRLLLPPAKTALDWLSRRDLVVFKHPVRKCIFEEAEACRRLEKGKADLIKAQVRAYKKAGMPRYWGLVSTRCVMRRHTLEVAKLNEAWWKEIQQHSLRDQISLPFVCWREKFQWEMIPRGIRRNNDFWFIPHGRRIRKMSDA